MIAKPQVVVPPIPPLTSDLPLELPFISKSLFRSRLAVAGLACAVTVNLVWIGFLGYGFFKLAERAFL